MAIIKLFDGPEWYQLFPLTLTRSVGDLRMGALTFRERLKHILQKDVEVHALDYIAEVYPTTPQNDTVIYVRSSWLAGSEDIDRVLVLDPGTSLWSGDTLLAWHSTSSLDSGVIIDEVVDRQSAIDVDHAIVIRYPEDLFLNNEKAIRLDFNLLTQNKKSVGTSEHVTIIGDPNHLYIESGVQMPHSLINTQSGPVYIGNNAVILEGAMLRGPLVIAHDAVVKMGAKIYGSTTIGPYCKAGGEIKRSIFSSYSNKSHDGYIGDSVIGSWCNFGADTNCSNMKNTLGTVKLYDMHREERRDTGQLFCGLIMGDHSRCGINTQFTTGSVVGTFTNIIDTQPANYVPPFSWGHDKIYDFEKAITVAKKFYSRKNKDLTEQEVKILLHIFDNR